ncbi:MAG: cytochrome ubiquinol oxidase subunit [Micavibrio sp.]|nr:cytochrome ubiquinol oxidase subunit [Micavibrio sp.]
MEFDPVVLARAQFAANITFHILFPAITIAMGWILLFFKTQFSRTKDDKWMTAYFFWTKIFALCFAMGIVSGVTMSFQFGTNWPGYMMKVGNIAGPLLAYEVLTAFFLEATFLGIMLFGYRKVSNRFHTFATFLVAAGTTLSAFWIIALNSWMQTPAGFEMIDGKAYATDWLQIVFNPSMPYRLTHMLLASGLTAAFLVAGISAYRWLRGDRVPAVLAAMKTGVYMAAMLIPLQIMAGDMHGLNTLKHQPQKIAAMEALWKTEKSVPLILFALPDEKSQSNRFSIEIPKAASLILTHHRDGEIRGLNEFKGEHPPVGKVFWGFRIMVGMGMLMLVLSWLSAYYLKRRDTLPRPLLLGLLGMTFSGWIATVAGWYVTEIGRQPYLVYGILRTEDAVSTATSPMIGLSLTLYLITYAGLLTAFISTVFHMARKAGIVENAPPKKGVQDV